MSALLIVIAAAMLVPPLCLDSYAVEIGFRLLTLFVLCEAWNLLAGYGGLVSLGFAWPAEGPDEPDRRFPHRRLQGVCASDAGCRR